MAHQKIAIALPLEENLLTPLHHWGKRFDWTQIQQVHLVHVVKKTITPLEFGLVEMPDEKTYNEMLPTLQKFLKDEAQKIIPPSFKGEILFHISREYSPEDEFIETINKTGVSLVIVSTHGKHGFQGLFHNSFTDHMVKFAPCDVYVVRPETQA